MFFTVLIGFTLAIWYFYFILFVCSRWSFVDFLLILSSPEEDHVVCIGSLATPYIPELGIVLIISVSSHMSSITYHLWVWEKGGAQKMVM